MTQDEIKNVAPVFAQDFHKYITENYNGILAKLASFYDLPFEFQLGLFIKFFQENTIEIEPLTYTLDALEVSVTEGMKIYENIAGHYS